MLRKLRLVLLTLSCAFGSASFPAPASADSCSLKLAASFPMTEVEGDARAYFSAQAGTEERLFFFDTSSPQASLSPALVDQLHLVRHRLFQGMIYNGAGQEIREVAILPDLKVGEVHFQNLRAFVDPQFSDDRVGGSLGADILERNDVEFDFAAHKVNLFSQDHCPGKVIYWPADAYAAVPLRITHLGYPILSVMLEGQPFDAALDTAASDTVLDLDSAKGSFGLTPDSPGMTKVGTFGAPDAVQAYRYTFKSLNLNGIALSNIPILIVRDLGKKALQQTPLTGSRIQDIGVQNGVAHLSIGMHELRKLHVYLAYKDGAMYVTPLAPVAASVKATKS